MKDSTLFLLYGLSGEGKRGHGGAPDGENAGSKFDKLNKLEAKLDVDVLKLTSCQPLCPLVPITQQHVVQLRTNARNNDTVVSVALSTFSVDDLKRLQCAMGATNNEETRLRALSLMLFKDDLEPIKYLKNALETCKDSIESVTAFSVYTEFMSEGGRIEWNKLMKAINDAALQKAFEAGRVSGP
jgi:hypothetical protein